MFLFDRDRQGWSNGFVVPVSLNRIRCFLGLSSQMVYISNSEAVILWACVGRDVVKTASAVLGDDMSLCLGLRLHFLKSYCDVNVHLDVSSICMFQNNKDYFQAGELQCLARFKQQD